MAKSPNTQDIPLSIVGSTRFGRSPKISAEQTYNMFISDDWLVTFAGHKKVINFGNLGDGRELFYSSNLNAFILVINNFVYLATVLGDQNELTKVGEINTFTGDVFIAENNANQIAICDKKDIWIYNYTVGSTTFTKATLNFTPLYVSFQDGYFIAAARYPDGLTKPGWRLSDLNNGLSWPITAAYVGEFQTKPNECLACVPVPGKGGLLLIFGQTVTEAWQDVGAQLFPYQRTTGFNIDYGCLNTATIATSDNLVAWLGVNQTSGPAILVSTGGQTQQISDDGINYKLSTLKNPELAYGFFVKQDGHLTYRLTFPDPEDNVSYVYDFNTKKFFTLSDEYMNCHIAKTAAYANNTYYFLGFDNGNLYEMNSKYTTYDGAEIPLIRVTNTVRLPDTSRFVGNNLTFPLEQGEPNVSPFADPRKIKGGAITVPADFPYLVSVEYGDVHYVYSQVVDNDPTRTNTGQSFGADLYIVWNGTTWDVIRDIISRIDLSISRDGGVTFGTAMPYVLHPQAYRKNKVTFWKLGSANEMTAQLRFWGTNRFVAGEGLLNIYQ